MIDPNYDTVDCDLCGSDDCIEAPYLRNYTGGQPLFICKNCGLVYARFRRSSQAIAECWSKERYKTDYTARIPAVISRQIYVAEHIDVNLGLQSKKVLDIGTGEGQFLEIINNNYNADALGTEDSIDLCKNINSKNL